MRKPISTFIKESLPATTMGYVYRPCMKAYWGEYRKGLVKTKDKAVLYSFGKVVEILNPDPSGVSFEPIKEPSND